MKARMEQDLDLMLARLAAEPPPLPGPALMARLIEDAARLQPALPMPAAARATPGAAPPRGGSTSGSTSGSTGGWIGTLAEMFGGRGALAGMMLATVTGLWLGVAQPVSLAALTGAADTPLESLDLMAGSDGLWTEAAQ